MSGASCLVVAKAPQPGRVKTRLAAAVGDEVAAQAAAASLLDTLDVCAATFPRRFLALEGDLLSAVAGDEITAALETWTVFPQRGTGLAERLENAHLDAHARCRGPVVQVGMDTPHMTTDQLARVLAPLGSGSAHAVLGHATDGGWWALGLVHPRWARGLAAVEMSSPHTGRLTRQRLQDNGARVRSADVVCDIDTAEDAAAVSLLGGDSRFQRLWRSLGTAAAS